MNQPRAITCPTCGLKWNINDDPASVRNVRCPQCAEFIILPPSLDGDDGYALADESPSAPLESNSAPLESNSAFDESALDLPDVEDESLVHPVRQSQTTPAAPSGFLVWISCPHCEVKMKVRNPAHLGQAGKCPNCGEMFVATAPR